MYKQEGQNDKNEPEYEKYIEGSGISWHAANFMTTTALFDDSWLLPGGALERKLDMTQRNDPQPGTDKQKMSKLNP